MDEVYMNENIWYYNCYNVWCVQNIVIFT